MGFFSSLEEVDKYIGEMFRQANDHPKVGGVHALPVRWTPPR